MTRKPPDSEFEPGEDENADLDNVASVVLVDPRDDIAAVCGRVDTAPTFAVVVHAPKGNRALATELGMRRLQRHAEESGRLVAVATRSGGITARARQAGVPVARRPEHVRWDSGGHKVLRIGGWSMVLPSLGGWPQRVAVLAIVAAVALFALTVGPAGSVTVTPPMETLAETVVLTAMPGLDEPDYSKLQVPARQVTGTQSLTLSVPATGKKLVPIAPAKLAVTLTNPGTKEVRVPAHAVLIGPGMQFELDEEVIVPAGKTAPGAATAVQAGKAGNAPPGTVTKWEDAALKAIAVTNATAGQGGTDEERPAVDAKDLAALMQLAIQVGESQSLQAKVLAGRPHDTVFLRTATSSVSTGQPSAPVGGLADIVLMDIKVSVTALAIPQQTLEAVASTLLAKDRGAGELVPGTVSATETGARQVNADDGTVRTEVRLAGKFVSGVTRDDLRDAVKGRSEADARSTLAERYGIQDADVRVSPGWAPWLPRVDFRIDVTYRAPEQPDPTGAQVEAPPANANSATTTPAPPRP